MDLRAVTNLRFAPEELRRLERALGGIPLEQIDSDADLGGAEIAFLAGDTRPETLLGWPELSWAHIDISGLERFARRDLIENGPAITGAAGRSAPVLAEHALMFMLAFSARLPELLAAQAGRHWSKDGQRRNRGLFGQCVGIVGLGETGRALASRCRAMGMRLLAYSRSRRDAELVDRLYSTGDEDGLSALLRASDFLVLCAPLTDQTRDMIAAAQFNEMKPGAVLINIARGGLVVEEDLVAALRSGRIGGAGLDVFRREPLPADHPLWKTPNTILTPHCSAAMPDGRAMSLDIIEDNIARFLSGAPLRNLLQPHHLLSRS